MLRVTFTLAVLITLASDLGLYFLLPETVATHFDRAGNPNGWMTKEFHLGFLLVLHLAFFAIFFFAPTLVIKSPPRFLNIPNRDFWLQPENRDELYHKWRFLMDSLGLVIFLFFLLMNLVIFEANQSSEPHLNDSLFLTFFVSLLIYMLWWMYKVFSSFRIPE